MQYTIQNWNLPQNCPSPQPLSPGERGFSPFSLGEKGRG